MSELAARMYQRVAKHYPICRSITGEGTRQTLRLIQNEIPITINEVRSGTPVLDWEIPQEWVLESATLYAPDGSLVSDVSRHSLELLNYSDRYIGTISRQELEAHLHSLPSQSDLIPYKTSYYARSWGFCLPHRVRESLPDGNYQVEIKTSLVHGSLSYGELLIPGESTDEVLLTTHICHPSLANDNCSGISLLTELGRSLLSGKSHHLSFRLLFLPGTIGAITWLGINTEHARRHVKQGLVIANVGDRGGFHYKRSRQENAAIDRVIEQINIESPERIQMRNFSPYGYDERQFCSPGFNLAVGSLTRTPHGQYPEYHTSADNLDFISGESLARSLELFTEVLEILDQNRYWRNMNPDGEPMLGRRGLYRQTGGHTESQEEKQKAELAMLWVLNQSDGGHDLLSIARRSGLPFRIIEQAAARLREKGLLADSSSSANSRFE
jgi:aminopeptidase-like protein